MKLPQRFIRIAPILGRERERYAARSKLDRINRGSTDITSERATQAFTSGCSLQKLTACRCPFGKDA